MSPRMHSHGQRSLLALALVTLAGTASASPARFSDGGSGGSGGGGGDSGSGGGGGGDDGGGGGVKALDTLPVPRPQNLRDFVKNDQAAVVLGKALFWESQVGGDGIQACATCHFSSGGDPRSRNTVNPGPNGIFEEAPVGGRLTADRFPVHSDDRVGSQGLVDHDFVSIVPGNGEDNGIVTPNATYLDNRQVTGRNTPTVVNSVFNFETFWDGRAKNVFNGRTPGGLDPTALLLRVGNGGAVSKVSVEIRGSAAASQSVGPPNNGVEMSYEGRTFFDLGKKVLSLKPLGNQDVAADDSVLGGLRDASGKGLSTSYADLVRAAIQDAWWNSDAIVDRSLNVVGHGTPSGLDQFSVMESNFSLIWGLSIQMYMSTLTSGDAPIDRFAKGNTGALSALQKQGLALFDGQARCDECHSGAMLTDVVGGTGGHAFVNTGVRPVAEDAGRGLGAFKTATVRNTELTGPYFHNGGYGTLRQVVDFYDRGGDFPNEELRSLGLSESQKVALVAFLLSATDDRVRFQRAPFDHPSLRVPNGDSISAVGRNGGPEITPFLGLDPFDAGGGSQALIVDAPGGLTTGPGTHELTLVSYANRGGQFFLCASVGDSLRLPAGGIAPPTRMQMRRLMANRQNIRIVASGTLDSIGTAALTVAVPAGSAEYFFAIVDPLTMKVRTLSEGVTLSAAP